jgi:hypothetical protein
VIGMLVAGLLVWAASPDQASDTAFERRMRDSAAAAQALQGPLDGRWLLTDAKGRTLYAFQIADPPHEAAPLTAAWTDPHTGALGGVDAISRAGDSLSLTFAPDPSGPPVRLTLRRLKRGAWSGWATAGAARRKVRLSLH